MNRLIVLSLISLLIACFGFWVFATELAPKPVIDNIEVSSIVWEASFLVSLTLSVFTLYKNFKRSPDGSNRRSIASIVISLLVLIPLGMMVVGLFVIGGLVSN